jgi:hypothetical protein
VLAWLVVAVGFSVWLLLSRGPFIEPGRERKVRVSRSERRPPATRGDAHAAAVEKLDSALDEQVRKGRQEEVAAAGPAKLNAGVELAAANEQVAARKAWLDYVEHGQ